MIMKRTIFFLAMALALLAQHSGAQTPNTGSVTVTVGGVTKTWTFTLPSLIVITDLHCDATAIAPGGSSVCTVTLNQPMTSPFVVPIVVSPALTGPSSVIVPIGANV